MPITNLQKAENERETHKTLLKLIQTEYDARADSPLDEIAVQEYLTQLNDLWKQLIDNHRKLLESVAVDKDITSYVQDHEDLLSKTMKLKIGMSRLSRPSTPTSSSSGRSSPSFADVKLPRIELPKFSGNISDWLSFKDLFISSVHANQTLSGSQKLSYLHASVLGNAARIIKSIQVTNANYDIAWNLLCDRYENERELKFHIMKKFITQPTIQNESAGYIRSLVDTSKECFRTLESLHSPVEYWDEFLVYTIISKLDPTTRQHWELSLEDKKIPTFQQVIDYLEARASALSASSNVKPRTQHVNHDPPQRKQITFHIDSKSSCKFCPETHLHFKCGKFQAMSISERREAVKNNALCFNCLREKHTSQQCTSKSTCQKCSRKHHTLLHEDRQQSTTKSNTNTFHSLKDRKHVIMATVIVKLQDSKGDMHMVRGFLDSGSDSSYIREQCQRRLGLKTQRIVSNVKGLGGATVVEPTGITSVSIQPWFDTNDFNQVFIPICHVIPKITEQMPSFNCDLGSMTYLEPLQLADPNFFRKGHIDLLLGGDVYWDILEEGIVGPKGSPRAIKTTFGWIVGGLTVNKPITRNVFHVQTAVQDTLQRFWELEEVPPSINSKYSIEEQACEKHFLETTTQNSNGRYVVELPFKDSHPPLGQSRGIALRRLQQLERKLESKPEMKTHYHNFMLKYEELGHMKKVPPLPESKTNTSYYIPHHFVLKDPDHPEKFRVVFDASAKSSTGNSLNNTLMVGPTIQKTLVSQLMNFRTHRIAFTADIRKMYRQILVHEKHQNFQRILWRKNHEEPVQEYQLQTITYGTASGPFQATRVLQKLVADHGSNLPLASQVVLNNTYVDDMWGGGPTIEKAIQTQIELRDLMGRGCMELGKFSSNSKEFMDSIPVEMRSAHTNLVIDDEETTTTLGLHWNTTSDQFFFKVKLPEYKGTVTKRSFLSEVSRTFDPNGWLAPTIIKAKIMFQDLWKQKIGWDDELPYSVKKDWIQFREELPLVEKIRIRRFLNQQDAQDVQLHGFSDASELAYSAVVYTRAYDDKSGITVSLIAAKTKVSPTKTQTIPRLELCGALLLCNLMQSVQESLDVKFSSVTAWTDSTVVLDWINSHASSWKTFVSNRIAKVQELILPENWKHVPGILNPADCASRGLSPAELIGHKLWWNGPQFLQDRDPVPFRSFIPASLEVLNSEKKKEKLMSFHVAVSNQNEIFNRYSCFFKLKRITAWCLRFARNCKDRVKPLPTTIKPQLSVTEIDQALITLIKVVQAVSYPTDLILLQEKKKLKSKSPILSLSPFLDSEGIIKVGGRLKKSDMVESMKHPILLPTHHAFTRMLIQYQHEANLHAAPQLLLTILRQKYWIVGGRDAIRRVTKKCMPCLRQAASLHKQLMGNLPVQRVVPSRAFTVSGVDYAGPFELKLLARSKVRVKAYICLFVCFSTRALHLELVSSLSAESFLAALRRFVSRRGLCREIFSDCGTNFTGASKELKELYQFIEEKQQTISKALASDGIQWKFNPPSAPHMGGIWEAGVRSVKFHLRRVIGTNTLNYEEFLTLLTQTEGCLNSRPLTELSSDPNDLSALTPAHFLIGGPLKMVPDPEPDCQLNRLNRWQYIQHLQRSFWQRWSSEYLTRLQQRPKWIQQSENLKIGQLVLVKDDRVHQTHWPLARIVKLHPGEDKVVRVVTIKDSQGEKQRPIAKLCPLPLE